MISNERLKCFFFFKQALIRNLWFGENIKEAIDSYRIHHQLMPMNFQYESGFPKVKLFFFFSKKNWLNCKFLLSVEYCREFEAKGTQRDRESLAIGRLRHFGRIGWIYLRQRRLPQGRRRRRHRSRCRGHFLI